MKNKNKIFTSLAVLGSAIFAMVLTAGTGVFEALGLFNSTRTTSSNATNLVLNKDNAYSSGLSQIINTTFGKNPIVFDYNDCSVQTNAHVYMADGATVGNYWKTNDKNSGINWNNKLTSIESIKPVFNAESGASLQFRASYDGKSSGAWGNFAPLTSNTTFTLASNPYYIELKAIGGSVSLTSCEICFSCIENTSATGTPKYETQATVNGGTRKTYSVDDSFDNLIGGSTKSRSVIISDSFEVVETLSDGTTRTLNKNEFKYKVNNSSGTQIDTSKAFGTTGTYTAFIKVGSLAEVAYEFNVEERLVEEIVIPATKSMNTGTSGSISVTSISPSNAHNKTIRWSSSDTSVATINSSTGAISALKAGTTTIKATATDVGGVASNGCTLTVTDISVTSVTLDKDSLLLYTDDNDVTLTATILPEDATVKTVNWSSNNTSVVTVTNGVVHPVGVGTAVITATSGSASDTCSVEVKSADARPKYFTFDFYNEDKIDSTNGSVLDVEDARDMMTCSDNTITDKSTVLTAFSNHSTTVQYNKNGGLTFGNGSNNGYATFTFGTSYLITKIEIIGVKYDDNATFTISDSYGEDAVEGSGQLNARKTKLEDCEYSIVWDDLSGNNAFCINSSGCRATIYTMVIYYGAPEPKPLTNIAVSLSTNSIKINGTAQATATLTPTNPDNPEYTWSASSDPTDVVSITSGGLITGLKEGTATIKATSNSDSSIYGTASITVSKEAVTSVTVSPSTASIVPGGYQDLTATVSPSTATYKSVTWSGGGNGISVNDSGRVTVASTATIGATATITATSDDNPNAKGTCTVTVKSNIVTPTSVTLNNSTLTLSPGGDSTLTATVGPTGASQDVTWSSNNSLVTVSSSGVVTASSSVSSTTTATITCTATGYPSVTAICTVTVKVSGGGGGGDYQLVESAADLVAGNKYVIASYDHGKTAGNISSSIMASVDSTFSSDGKTITSLGTDTVELTLGGSSGAWTFKNEDGQLLGATAVKKLAWGSGTTTWSISIDGDKNATIASSTSSYGKILYNVNSPRFTTYTSDLTASMVLPQLYYVSGTPVPAQTVDLDKTSVELSPGGSTTLTPIFGPTGANTDKDVSWSTNNSNVATVSNGQVQVKSTATVGQTATITCTLLSTGDTATCTVTVSSVQRDAWTIMIYMCGADLESGNANSSGGYATGDLDEIVSVKDQPDDVNIVIEAGGAKSWKSKYSAVIDKNKLNRFHLDNNRYVKDQQIDNASMGESSTLEDFITWGMTQYPAEKTALIFWNHGGAMSGVCYDENFDDDSLMNSEVNTALSNSLENNKLEWIGYDACLMGVQDVAEFNSNYANYMVCSEESEAGYGWDYDTWLDDLYDHSQTETILTAICEGFIADNNYVYYTDGSREYDPSENNQTLSWLKLSNMSAYKSAFDAFTTQLSTKLNNVNKNTFSSWVISNVKHFGDDDYGYYGLFDAYDFVNKIKNKADYNPGGSYAQDVLTAFNNLVGCSKKGSAAGNANGLGLIYSNTEEDPEYYALSDFYLSTETNFSKWRQFNMSKGYLHNYG